MNKYDEWLEEYKHLQGLHNQKKHGYRGGASVPAGGGNANPAGGTKVSQAAQATGGNLSQSQFQRALGSTTMKKFGAKITPTNNGFTVESKSFVDGKSGAQSIDQFDSYMRGHIPAGYKLTSLSMRNRTNSLGTKVVSSIAKIEKSDAGTKVSQAAQATGENPKFERHQNNVKKTTASVDSIDKSVSAPKPKADWADIGSASEVASQLDNIMEFAGLKAANSPAPFGRNEKNTPEIRAQRYAAYQTKIKSDLAALKKFLKAENKPTSKYVNADDFGYINEQLGNIMEFLGG